MAHTPAWSPSRCSVVYKMEYEITPYHIRLRIYTHVQESNNRAIQGVYARRANESRHETCWSYVRLGPSVVRETVVFQHYMHRSSPNAGRYIRHRRHGHTGLSMVAHGLHRHPRLGVSRTRAHPRQGVFYTTVEAEPSTPLPTRSPSKVRRRPRAVCTDSWLDEVVGYIGMIMSSPTRHH